MYLKGVEIQGFKTFVDRVKLEFGPGVTVIIGPNGSGKSNIADAVLWVLGEQSVKSLRGKHMDDIIFAGSETRRLVSMAEVALRVDNSDGSLPLDFQEIEVIRRFFRSGESEYYLNKAACRLKDIQELFLDTGSGRGGLAIVGQGRLEEIISMRPEERRAVLEETAGIARYRLRKKEARQRLESVEQDLLRLNDLIYELKLQIEQIAVEAAQARRHQRLNRILYLVELTLKARELEDINCRYLHSQRRLQALEAERKEQEVLEQGLEARAREFQEQKARCEEARKHYQAELQSLQEQLVKTQGELNLVREKRATLARQQQEIERAEKFLAEEKARLDAVFNRLAGQREEINKEKNKLEEAITAGQGDKERLAGEVQVLMAELEQIKNNFFQVTHERANCHNELVRLEEKQTAMQRLLEQKRHQIQEFNQEETLLIANLQLEQEQRLRLEEELERLEEEKADLERGLPLKENELVAKEKQLANLNERLRILEARLKVLRQAQTDYEGFGEGVKFILRARSRGETACAGVLGVVVEKLRVPAELTRAVDAALGGASQQILVRTEAEAERVIQYLKGRRGGRVTILPIDWLEPRRWPAWAAWTLKEPGVLGVVADLVHCDPEIRPAIAYLLGQILIVKDIGRALSLGAQLRPPVRLVTLEGEIIQPKGAVTGGVSRQMTGFLQRRLEIQQLEIELTGLKAEIRTSRQQLEEIKQAIQNNRHQYRQVTEKLIVYRSELHMLLQKNSSSKQQLANLKEKINVMEKELVQSTANTQYIDIERAKRQELLANLKVRESELNKQLTNCQERLASCQQALNGVQQELAVNHARWQAIENAEEQLNARETDLARQRENWQRQQDELEARRAAATVLAKELRTTEEKLSGEEVWLQGACQQIRTGFERLEAENSNCNEQQEELKREMTRLQAKKEKLAASRQQEEINLARLETVQSSLQAEINERFGPAWEEELRQNCRHLEKRATRLQEILRQKLALLGEVDPGAITVWERLKARYEELEQQKQDLEGGRAALEQVISEMEKLMARQLKATFVEVQEQFAAIFRELFEGGEASLQLTDSDILTAGLEIFARPPGKKNQHLSLLSGGEKALTAIAFIFALLKVKPSAFCIFDEIDTALDEANVERFTRLLRQFATQTQFIVISHRQGTMVAADVLYGVTMVEQGVSRLVSVRLEQLPA